MNKNDFSNLIKTIDGLDNRAVQSVCSRWDSLTKPPESLGKLEKLVSRLGGIQNTSSPHINHKTILCFAADHGVVAEGVSPSKQIVTAEMVKNFLNGGAAISVLAACTGASLKVVDAGMVNTVDHPKVIHRPVAAGTANMKVERAMTERQVYQALSLGYEMAVNEIQQSCDLLLIGEMGVGNTTSASAIYSAVSGMSPQSLTGPGAGLPVHLVGHKALVIKESLDLHKPDPTDPVDILGAVGGFELAAMTGVILAGAVHRCAVLVDGFISGASAVLAMLFSPRVKDFLFFSHQSGETGFKEISQKFDIDPLVDLNMRLGEGTGAVMVLPLIENALACYYGMATFEEAGVTEIVI